MAITTVAITTVAITTAAITAVAITAVAITTVAITTVAITTAASTTLASTAAASRKNAFNNFPIMSLNETTYKYKNSGPTTSYADYPVVLGKSRPEGPEALPAGQGDCLCPPGASACLRLQELYHPVLHPLIQLTLARYCGVALYLLMSSSL